MSARDKAVKLAQHYLITLNPQLPGESDAYTEVEILVDRILDAAELNATAFLAKIEAVEKLVLYGQRLDRLEELASDTFESESVSAMDICSCCERNLRVVGVPRTSDGEGGMRHANPDDCFVGQAPPLHRFGELPPEIRQEIVRLVNTIASHGVETAVVKGIVTAAQRGVREMARVQHDDHGLDPNDPGVRVVDLTRLQDERLEGDVQGLDVYLPKHLQPKRKESE